MLYSDWPICYVNQDKGVAVFDEITIESDPITDPREERILVILEEEQVFMCRQMSPHLKKGALVLDVGTGSGVYAIAAAKRGCKVIAIDISLRAIAQAKYNANLNHIEICGNPNELENGKICLILARFDKNFLENFAVNKGLNAENLFDIVFLAPPYNPTCPGIFPALHAAAGEDGQKAFEEQIQIIPSVLKENGICIGNQMTLVENESIKALDTIQDSFGNCAIEYIHILGKDNAYIPVENFLKQQYENYLVDEQDSILSSESHLPSKKDVEDYIYRVSYEIKNDDGTYSLSNKNTDINRQFALIYFEIKKTQISQIQEIKSELIPKKTGENRMINWQDRIFLHKNIIEHACQIGTFKIPSLFLSDFPHPFSVKPISILNDNREPKDIRQNRIRLIGGIIECYNLLKEFDIILLDTAPVYKILGGQEKLPEVCHLWLSEDWNSEELNQNLLQEWYLNTICQQKSSIGPFHHPIFTGVCARGNWAELLYSSYVEGLDYFQYNSLEEAELQEEYDNWINNEEWTDGNTKQKIQQNRNVYLDYLIFPEFLKKGFIKSTLGHLYVPNLENYYKDLKNPRIFPAIKNNEIGKQIREKFKCEFLMKDYEGDFFTALSDKSLQPKQKAKILELLQNDLKHRHWTMHKQIDERFSQHFEDKDINFSILIGLPLSLKTKPFLEKCLDSEKLSFEIPNTYRGGLWLYAASKKLPNVKIQQVIFNLIRFSWLLYLDEYTTDIVEASIPVAKTQILHQLPKDLAAFERYLLSFQQELAVIKSQVKQQNLSVTIPELIMPDYLGVMMMLAQASDPQEKTRKLIELPKDCSETLYKEWNLESIQNFVDRIVWDIAFNRAYDDAKIIRVNGKTILSKIQIENKDLKPKLIIEKPFKLKTPLGIYPLLLFVLRNAYQHSVLQTLLNEPYKSGRIEIRYSSDKTFEKVIILNTGIFYDNDLKSQSGLERDLAVFDKLTNDWSVTHFIRSQIFYSKYDDSSKMWITEIIRQGVEL